MINYIIGGNKKSEENKIFLPVSLNHDQELSGTHSQRGGTSNVSILRNDGLLLSYDSV